MPTISTPSKIASTQAQGAKVYFSGSTAPEREKLLHEIQAETDAVFVPPYDHPDIILGQGTLALEFEQQVKDLCKETIQTDNAHEGYGWRFRATRRQQQQQHEAEAETEQNGNGHDMTTSSEGLDAVVAPCGGGGMLSGVATALHGTGIHVFGAEPSYQGGDDARRSLASDPPTRIESVSTLTIADGLRTPLGKLPWTIISDPQKVRGIYGVTEDQIKSAMRLIYERMKVVVEPSAAVPLAVCLFDEGFRRLVEREGGEGGWNVGVVLSGGNTTMEAVAKLFAEEAREKGERAEAKVGMRGEKVAENVAG